MLRKAVRFCLQFIKMFSVDLEGQDYCKYISCKLRPNKAIHAKDGIKQKQHGNIEGADLFHVLLSVDGKNTKKQAENYTACFK